MAIYCAKCDYTIGAEGKIKINEARGDYFFTLMSRFGAIFFALAHKWSVLDAGSHWEPVRKSGISLIFGQ